MILLQAGTGIAELIALEISKQVKKFIYSEQFAVRVSSLPMSNPE